MSVEFPEVDQFTCSIDFGLMTCLGLAEHRGGVQTLSPSGTKKLGGSAKMLLRSVHGSSLHACRQKGIFDSLFDNFRSG